MRGNSHARFFVDRNGSNATLLPDYKNETVGDIPNMGATPPQLLHK
jgi:hypothetical protein